MVSVFMTGRVKSSRAGLWAVTRLPECTGSSGKVSGVVTGLVGAKKNINRLKWDKHMVQHQTQWLNQERQIFHTEIQTQQQH